MYWCNSHPFVTQILPANISLRLGVVCSRWYISSDVTPLQCSWVASTASVACPGTAVTHVCLTVNTDNCPGATFATVILQSHGRNSKGGTMPQPLAPPLILVPAPTALLVSQVPPPAHYAGAYWQGTVMSLSTSGNNYVPWL